MFVILVSVFGMYSVKSNIYGCKENNKGFMCGPVWNTNERRKPKKCRELRKIFFG